jgi:cysteinyl-tRNA synthetase
MADQAFADDFNTPKAMEAVLGLMKYTNQLLSHKVFEKVSVKEQKQLV